MAAGESGSVDRRGHVLGGLEAPPLPPPRALALQEPARRRARRAGRAERVERRRARQRPLGLAGAQLYAPAPVAPVQYTSAKYPIAAQPYEAQPVYVAA